ncbi:MAG: hypothetical protein MK142_04515 [Pseudomonadales bacterium]|nr:hypothetical protein [Pseudomonadales bacterium]
MREYQTTGAAAPLALVESPTAVPMGTEVLLASKRGQAMTEGGAVAALDSVGSESSASLGLSVLRKGGRPVVMGLYGGQLTMPLPFLPTQARILEGNHVGSLRDMGALMGLVRAGRIPPIEISERPACDAGDVLADLKAGRIIGRAVLRHA